MVLNAILCEAISAQVLLEFDYNGEHRVVAPYCHGISTRGVEVLRAVQLRRPNSTSKRGGFGFGKLWQVASMKNVRLTGEPFTPDDPHYNPDDSAMARIHCRAMVPLR
jgi:hypothetical protein